ncbi:MULTISPECIES: SAV_915 family protein [unclassified Streptomyces]|uniref:SAV_915 family protein n=1 Tax=unclassified Streptomyces TaxID=2593676 RepID=UPI001CB6F6C1|nr:MULTISPECIES: SAV_915 family protein [unclassified Streptomyces]
MKHTLYGDDPEPAEPLPAGRLCVPVRPGPHGHTAVRLFRTPVGDRTAVAFTDPARLTAALGTGRPWIGLSEPALRALMEPLGVRALTVDPVLTAPSPVSAPIRTPDVLAVETCGAQGPTPRPVTALTR